MSAAVPVLLSKFSPAKIPGMALWLDAGNMVLNSIGPDVPAANGQTVRCWKDLSGKGGDASQATGASQPLLETNWRNGQPAVVFDGVNDRLVTANSPVTAAGNDTYTIITAGEHVTAAGYLWSQGGAGATPAYPAALYWPGASSNFIQGNGSTSVVNIIPSDTGSAIRSYRLTSAVIESRRNGALVDSDARLAGLASASFFYIGGFNGGYASCKFAHFLIYSRALSDLELVKLEAWLARKYGF